MRAWSSPDVPSLPVAGPVVRVHDTASDALVGASLFSTAAPGLPAEDPLQWWVGGLVLLGYAIVLVLLGHLISWRRDVT